MKILTVLLGLLLVTTYVGATAAGDVLPDTHHAHHANHAGIVANNSVVTVPSVNAPSVNNAIIIDKHYKILPKEIRNNPEVVKFRAKDPKKIQVIIFFSYVCHWCSLLDKPLDTWEQQHKTVKVYHVPAILSNPIFETLARAYYTTAALDKSGVIDHAIYKGIQDERINYTRETLLQQLFAAHGISSATFKKTYNSFAVNMEVAKAKVLTNAYGISSTPHIIINGRNNTYLTNLAMTRDVAVLLQTLNYIIDHD